MQLEWSKLRAWNGSKQAAFEELVSQLAAHEYSASLGEFIRKAPPDAGVECYWKLPNGDEIGWQAKFFTETPGTAQWRQIDKSVRRALEGHPRLIHYVVALPRDRADDRKPNRTSEQAKWSKRFDQWNASANSKGMAVRFEYWGTHEIFERLTRESHRGRRFFWFHTECFDLNWCRKQVEKAVSSAGERYHPELNVSLPVSEIFDGLARTSEFRIRLDTTIGRIRKAPRNLSFDYCKGDEEAAELEQRIATRLDELAGFRTSYRTSELIEIPLDRLSNCANAIVDASEALQRNLARKFETIRKDGSTVASEEHKYRSARYDLVKLADAAQCAANFFSDTQSLLANRPALLLVGEAGTGKTHLFCDAAENFVKRGTLALPVLGTQIGDRPPIPALIDILGLGNLNTSDFLGALSAAAETSRTRAVILIDAINEGRGLDYWPDHLPALLRELEEYPWLGVALSVRSSYERALVPQHLVHGQLIRHVHDGFAGHEYEAVKGFCKRFGFEMPTIPISTPEFSNPLFLYVLSKAIEDKSPRRLPDDVNGLTALFDFYLSSVNERICQPTRLDADPALRIVRRAVDALAEVMVDRGLPYLTVEEALSAVEGLHSVGSGTKSLFYLLLSEGVLRKDVVQTDGGAPSEFISFTYQKFSDLALARTWLDRIERIAREADVDSWNEVSSSLAQRFQTEYDCYSEQGLMEALSILVPERYSHELFEALPALRESDSLVRAFIESLVWRKHDALQESAFSFVNQVVLRYEHWTASLFEAMLSVATKKQHPFNAETLHRYLRQLDPPERDCIWSAWVSLAYRDTERISAVRRLVDWAGLVETRQDLDEGTVFLWARAVSWFLVSSNRALRDRATKALVRLLRNRIALLMQLLTDFQMVNDLYVTERLYAVAYGCAMLGAERDELAKLGHFVFSQVFQSGDPVPNILLRDYARGTIEVAARSDPSLAEQVRETSPPFHSEWDGQAPEKCRLDARVEELGAHSIKWSALRDGDFARYIIDGDVRKWCRQRRDESRPPARREMNAAFASSLSENQRRLWKEFLDARSAENLGALLIECAPSDAQETNTEYAVSVQATPEDRERTELLRSEFRLALTDEQREIFRRYADPDIENEFPEEKMFDADIARRWIVNRALDFGWREELFGEIERLCRSDDRTEHRVERIGKKYQWLAHYELLARISDNYRWLGESYGDANTPEYQGPWQLYLRNIDPSYLLHASRHKAADDVNLELLEPDHSMSNDDAWLKRDATTLDPRELIDGPQGDSKELEWLCLTAYRNVSSTPDPSSPLEEWYQASRTEWWKIRSFVYAIADEEKILEWARSNDWWGHAHMDPPQLHQILLGEYPESYALASECPWLSGDSAWDLMRLEEYPFRVLPSTIAYVWERGGYDYSIEDTAFVQLLHPLLARRLDAHWSPLDCTLRLKGGEIIARDPSVSGDRFRDLLLRRSVVRELRERLGYALFWTVIGAREVRGEGGVHLDRELREREFVGTYWLEGETVLGRFRERER